MLGFTRLRNTRSPLRILQLHGSIMYRVPAHTDPRSLQQMPTGISAPLRRHGNPQVTRLGRFHDNLRSPNLLGATVAEIYLPQREVETWTGSYYTQDHVH